VKRLSEGTKIGRYTIMPDFQYYDLYIWVVRESDNEVTIGLTDYGQHQLKDIVNVDFPSVSQRYAAGKTIATIESISREYSMKSPVSCIVTEVNKEVMDNPEILNSKPYEGWLLRVEVIELSQLDKLMDSEDMADLIAEEVGMEPRSEIEGDEDEFDYEKEFSVDSSNDYYSDKMDDPYDYDYDDDKVDNDDDEDYY
jgi:glycine cleavage system H protein